MKIYNSLIYILIYFLNKLLHLHIIILYDVEPYYTLAPIKRHARTRRTYNNEVRSREIRGLNIAFL